MSRQEKSIQKQKDCAAAGISHDLNAIKSIEDKYGLILFRMGLTHLVDIGVRNFDEEAVQESIEENRSRSGQPFLFLYNLDGQGQSMYDRGRLL